MSVFDYPIARFHPDDRDLLLTGSDGDRFSNTRYLLDLGFRWYAIRATNPNQKPLKKFREKDLPLLFAGYRVVDGDSAWYVLDMGEGMFSLQSFRYSDIDTPELRTAAGKQVRDVSNDWHSHNIEHMRAESSELDKFGRSLGTPHNGHERLSQLLLDKQLARPYTGGRRQKWPEQQLDAIERRASQYLEVG